MNEGPDEEHSTYSKRCQASTSSYHEDGVGRVLRKLEQRVFDEYRYRGSHSDPIA